MSHCECWEPNIVSDGKGCRCSYCQLPPRIDDPDILRDQIEELTKERDDARAEVERLSDPLMKDMRLANGQLDMSVCGPIVERMALAMTGYFRESGAENYIELNLNARDEPFERFCVIIQKVGQKSPHQFREEAERERDELRAKVAAAGRDDALLPGLRRAAHIIQQYWEPEAIVPAFDAINTEIKTLTAAAKARVG